MFVFCALLCYLTTFLLVSLVSSNTMVILFCGWYILTLNTKFNHMYAHNIINQINTPNHTPCFDVLYNTVVPNLFYYIPPFAHFGTSHSSPITRVYENSINGYILFRLPFTCHGELIFELGRLYGLQMKNGLY